MGFYDAKGYWRSDGDGFYDSKGNWVSPGGAFYDGKGYLRSPGDSFYDSKGNWVSPGDAFYDGKGYLQSGVVATVKRGEETGTRIVLTVGFLLSLPVLALWMLTMSLVNWISSHLYLVFSGYVIADIVLSFAITKVKKHSGIKAVFSFFGSFMCILSLVYITLVYAVPYVLVNDGTFGAFFEFSAALAMAAGGIVILQFFNYYHEKAALEFVLGILFFAVVIILIKYNTDDMNTIESLAKIYHVKATKLFMALFGFAAR